MIDKDISMDISEIKEYLSKSKSKFDMQFLDFISNNKALAVKSSNEELANELWCLYQVAVIQSSFLSMYALLKKKEKHQEAWNILGRIDIELSLLRPHFNCSNDEYDLFFIGNIVHEYEKLFPYFFFLSREGIIKRESCSICGKTISLRNKCEHEVGNLYMGECCYRNVVEYEFLGIAIVENPFDKYTVVSVSDQEYNYFMLNYLIDNIASPYDRFYIEVIEEKDPIYAKAKRNEFCVCGSGIKYKKCCLGTNRELI